jgi:phosphatidylglycerol:prolipoprotein diacylglycerol transferase
MSLSATILAAAQPIRWTDLGLDPVWWYLLKLVAKPGAPMAKRHADDLVFYATLGIILGGRLGYVLFYRPGFYIHDPLQIVRLWDGGMSFHGGVIGTSLGIFYLARKNGLNWLRIHDYVACCVPFGLFFGRLANFVNGELWGKETDVPWAMIFPTGGDVARHPSQLYEAGLEGILLFLVLWFLFWKTKARYEPGKLVGTFLLGYGLCRFFVEYFREADEQLQHFAEATHLHMGQWLSLPMILGGIYLIVTAKGRRERVEPIAGSESVA